MWLQRLLASFKLAVGDGRLNGNLGTKAPTPPLVPVFTVDASKFITEINRAYAKIEEEDLPGNVMAILPDDVLNEVHVKIDGRTIKLIPHIDYFEPRNGEQTVLSPSKTRNLSPRNGKMCITAQAGPWLSDPAVTPKLAAIQADLALIDQRIGDLVVNIKLNARIHQRRRTPYARAIHAFVEGVDLGLKYWSFTEQQHRKILVRDIEEIVEEQTGEVFASFDEWLVDLERSPRYKPDRELTRCWYKIQYGAPVFREICRLGKVDRQLARESVSRYVRWRLTEGSISDSTENEIAALDERLWHEHIPSHESYLVNIASVLTKRQISSIFETASELAQLATQHSDELTVIVEQLERLATPKRGGRVKPVAFSPRPPPRTTSQ